MNEHIIDFMKDLRSIEDSDYGDFMRKANLYFDELTEALGPQISNRAKQKLSEIQDYLQFKPDWNRENTLHRLSKDVLDLELILDEAPSKNFDFHPHLHP